MAKKIINKRNLIIAVIFGIFLVAVIMNATSSGSRDIQDSGKALGKDDTAQIMNIDYYTAFRENRDSVRAKEVEYLESVLKTENIDEETKNEVNAQKLSIVECMESELLIESAIKSKGFTDAAVTFHKGSVNVVVAADALEKKDVAQILDIVMRTTNEPANNIKISVQR